MALDKNDFLFKLRSSLNRKSSKAVDLTKAVSNVIIQSDRKSEHRMNGVPSDVNLRELSAEVSHATGG